MSFLEGDLEVAAIEALENRKLADAALNRWVQALVEQLILTTKKAYVGDHVMNIDGVIEGVVATWMTNAGLLERTLLRDKLELIQRMKEAAARTAFLQDNPDLSHNELELQILLRNRVRSNFRQ